MMMMVMIVVMVMGVLLTVTQLHVKLLKESYIQISIKYLPWALTYSSNLSISDRVFSPVVECLLYLYPWILFTICVACTWMILRMAVHGNVECTCTGPPDRVKSARTTLQCLKGHLTPFLAYIFPFFRSLCSATCVFCGP